MKEVAMFGCAACREEKTGDVVVRWVGRLVLLGFFTLGGYLGGSSIAALVVSEASAQFSGGFECQPKVVGG